jgi:putative hydroxymethylpyrimidine transport system substrate-binding protein
MKRTLLICLLSILPQITLAGNEKLTVLLDWFPNPEHAPLIIAKQQGYFAEKGLDVELISPTEPMDPAKLLTENKVDVGITYEPEYMQQVDAGLPLISIGALIDKPLNSLVALKGNGIRSLNDLKGKRIGSNSGGLSLVMLKVMLKKSGLSEKDVRISKIRYNLMQALLSHKVDAVTGIMRNMEVPMIESNSKKVVTFFPEDHGVPSYSELVFIIHTQNIHDSRYPRFLQALKKAVRYLDEHPQLAWEDFIKAYPETNNTVNHEAWFATMPYFAEDPAGFNDIEWHKFASFMQKNQLIKKVQPTSRYAVVLRGDNDGINHADSDSLSSNLGHLALARIKPYFEWFTG